jgi:exodeoxyribonuclease V alpha subunit
MGTPSPTLQRLTELGILPADAPAAILHAQGLESDSVTLTECQTVIDLLELAGIPDPPSELHALLLALFATRNQGSLCLPLNALTDELRPFCGTQAEPVAASITEQLEQNHWNTLIGDTDGAPIILKNDHLYFQRYYRHEKSLETRIQKLCNSLPPPLPEDINLVELTIACAAYEGFSLNTEQRWGVYLACRNRYSIISGGPGTGKTTLVASLLRALWRLGTQTPARIHLVAPTGRAANRLGESLRAALAHTDEAPSLTEALSAIEGQTIHRLLRYSPSKHAFLHNDTNPIDTDLIVCDEVSMIDVVLMDQLLAAIPPHARVIFLGDRDQLPSVEAGAVLSELIPRDEAPSYSKPIADDLQRLASQDVSRPATDMAPSLLQNHVVLLQQSHRTKGDVSRAAFAINAGDPSPLDLLPTYQPAHQPWPLDAATCHRIDTSSTPDATAVAWVRQLLCHEAATPGKSYAQLAAVAISSTDEGSIIDTDACHALFAALRRGQILTLTRHGAAGCETLNRAVVRQLRGDLAPYSPTQSPLFAGLPIMVTRNNRLHGLYNGDIGIILKTAHGEQVAAFPRSESSYIAIPIHQLPQHTPAFAITIHKSQGSEYDNVLMILPDDPNHRLLTRELLYTGITRTKGSAFLLASPEVLRSATERHIRRYSGTSL